MRTAADALGARQKLSGEGLDTLSSSPEEFASQHQREVEKWAKVAEATAIHAN